MTSRVFKILNSGAGFSMPELMIGGAILAGIALGSAHLFKNQKLSQKKIEHEQKLMMYHQNLTKTLNIPAHCNATLKQYVPAGNSIPDQDISTLYTCVSGCEDLNLETDGSYDAYTAGSYVGAPLVSVYQFIDNTEIWRIEGIRLKGRNNTGSVVLEVDYKLNPKLSNAKTVSREITLSTRFSGGSFKECINPQESSVNNLQSDLCKSLNMNIDIIGSNGEDGNYSSDDGRMARWDDATQTCIVDGSKDCSTIPGMQVDGMGSDGVVGCKPILEGAASQIQNTTFTECLPPNKPTIKYDTGSKKMVIECVP